MMWLQIFSLACVAVAILAIIGKVLRYLRAPQHMRWELYPVPHEKGRAEYGGSYLEELDWWTKPRESDKFNELKEMAEEVLLLKGVYKNNRRVWSSSFPFHFGMYLLIGWLVLLLGGAILQQAGVAIGAEAGMFGQIVHYLTAACGYAGLVMTAFGALGLFIWRATDDRQKEFNAPIDYFNLILMAGMSVVVLVAHITVDPAFAALRQFVGATVTFAPVAIPSTLFGVAVGLLSFSIMWVTITRMSHFVAKYFLYHAVRWNDEPNERGSKIEASLVKLLNEKVTWSADHIQQGKTWAEVVKEMKK